jgi:hypothetical protein
MCLDVRGGVATDGAPVQIYTCHSGANQRWQFVGRPLNLAFYIDQVAADETNESGGGNTRDETYILSRGLYPVASGLNGCPAIRQETTTTTSS